MNQSELEANTCNRRQVRENACEQVAIGLTFTSDWWRKKREIFQPITERSKAKPKQNANYFRHSNEKRSNHRHTHTHTHTHTHAHTLTITLLTTDNYRI